MSFKERELENRSLENQTPRSLEGRSLSEYVFAFEEVSPERQYIGGKAANLVLLRQAGLPVPPGFCITTEMYDLFLNQGRVPVGLVAGVKRIKDYLGGRIVVRSSATCEDGDKLSLAGVFESIYLNDDEGDDFSQIEQAIRRIYEQSLSSEVREYLQLHNLDHQQIKMGLVVQQLIAGEISGIIYTGVNDNELLVQYVQGLGDCLADGKIDPSAVRIERQGGQIVQSTNYDELSLPCAAIDQLLQHAQKINRLFPQTDQDIEFTYRDGQIFILQSRALTADLGSVELSETPESTLQSVKRQLYALVEREKSELGGLEVVFSAANYQELLPHPAEMDFGMFARIFSGRNGVPGAIQLGRKILGYPLGDESVGFLHYIGGKPYFSLARDAGTFYSGFPESRHEYYATLVAGYIHAVNTCPELGQYPEMGLYLQAPTLADLQGYYGNRAAEYYEVHQQFSLGLEQAADSFYAQFQCVGFLQIKEYVGQMASINLADKTPSELVEYGTQIMGHLRTVSGVDFVQAARLGFYYSQRLRDEMNKYFAMQGSEVDEVFATLSQGLEGSLVTEVNRDIAQAPSKAAALLSAQKTIGHYSTQEMLEIRHARLSDDPMALAAYVDGIRNSDYEKNFLQQKERRIQLEGELLSRLGAAESKNFQKTLAMAQTYMALRETVKYFFTQEYALFKDALEMVAKKLGMKTGAIYHLYPEELAAFIRSPESFAHLLEARAKTFQNHHLLDLPSVIREVDIENIGLVSERQSDFFELSGKFLAHGPTFIGTVVNLDEYERLEEIRNVLQSYHAQNIPVVLAARQMNLGCDPFIASVGGLIIENAGIVSHGAQRAREMGRGALGGIPSRRLQTGMKILFNPTKRIIQKIE